MTYSYPFICYNLDKYEDLIREARTVEERKFRVEQLRMFQEQIKRY